MGTWSRSSTTLQSAGIQRSSLYMAWDFTVASEESLTGARATIRDDALDAPRRQRRRVTTTATETRRPSPVETVHREPTLGDPNGERLPPDRRHVGARDVPCYLTTNICPPGGSSRFATDGDDHLERRLRLGRRRRSAASFPESVVDTAASARRRSRAPTGTACSADRTPGERPGGLANEDEHDLVRDRLGGLRRHDLAQVLRTLAATSRSFNSSSTACSRASSTSITSAGR